MLLVYSGARAHGDLHSFPTRRSSDLPVLRELAQRLPHAHWLFAGWGPLDPANSQCAWRSEEHTSELQSLRHLVCRLLLEKKKVVVLRVQQIFAWVCATRSTNYADMME